jgi:hypothetical protein
MLTDLFRGYRLHTAFSSPNPRLDSCFSRLISCLILILSLSHTASHAQERKLHYSAFTTFLGASGETPFWHYANTHGQIQPGSSFSNVSGLEFSIPFKGEESGLDFSLGAGIVNRFSNSGNTIHFQQLYGQLEYGFLRLSLGRFYETIGMNMHTLSTGSMMQSRNATPFPKIKLETTGFVDVPFTNGFFQFKARYSDGFLENDRVVPSPAVHQKSFYLKFKIENFEGHGGFIHNAIWGGGESDHGTRPQSFRDYLRIVFARPAAPGTGATGGEERNRLGNSIGAYDFSAHYTTDNIRFRAYRLFYLEDSPSVKFRSPWDGIWGVRFERFESSHALNSILYEHINTINQDAKNEIPKGRANYYNHFIYRSGWSYYGKVIGNPLLTYDKDSKRITNNMILAHHIALSGQLINRLSYRSMFTYSRNYGICDQRISPGTCRQIFSDDTIPDNVTLLPRRDFRQDQFSFLFELQYLLSEPNGIRLTGSASMDIGDHLGNRTGFLIGIKWSRTHIL